MSGSGRDGPVSRAKLSVAEAKEFLKSDAGTVAEFRRRRGNSDDENGDDDEPTTREEIRRQLEERIRRARAVAASGSAAAREHLGAAGRRAAAGARKRAEEADFSEFSDGRRKSRNQEVVERAERAGTIAPITDHSLDVLGGARGPEMLARAGMGLGAADLERRGSEAEPAPGLDPVVGGVDVMVAPMLLEGEPSEGQPDEMDPSAGVRDDLLMGGSADEGTMLNLDLLFGDGEDR